MLLRFGVGNFRSIDEYQEISFIASKLDNGTEADIAIRKHGKFEILPVVVVYGANASGKSNILKSLMFMKGAIKNSHTSTTESKGIKRDFFRLNDFGEKNPSRFDCDFVLSGIRYHYGFDVDSLRVVKEWLYSFPDGRKNILFAYEAGKPIYFGPSFGEKAKARRIETFLRENSLFLSCAAQNNIKIAIDISDWFRTKIKVATFSPEMIAPQRITSALGTNEDLRRRVVEFIKGADSGITDIEIVEHELGEDFGKFRDEMGALLKKHLLVSDEYGRSSDEKIFKEIRLKHRSQSGEVSFDLSLESSGTRKLLEILGPIFTCLDTGGVLIFDELEGSLHAAIASQLLAIFNSKASNTSGAQIFVTTHDTNLLDLKCFRRDQIWFTEKSSVGATHTYSLSELSVRKGDNIKRGYLQGRFGAIPFLPAIDRLCESSIVNDGR